MEKKKSYFDEEFFRSFLGLLFALAIFLLGTSINDLITPETPLINLEIAEENITRYLELQKEAERTATMTKALYSIGIVIGIVLIAFIITKMATRHSQKIKPNQIHIIR